MIEIRRAVYEDIPAIMSFIDEHWKKGHILARDRAFFEWQFMDGNNVNVFLGIDDEKHKIYGIQGVIRYNSSDNPDATGCIWKVIKNDNPRLGLDIADYAYAALHIRFSCGAGQSNKALKLGRLMGGIPIAMDHYYRLGDCQDYKIAVIKNKTLPNVEDSGFRLAPVHSVEEMKQVISAEALANHIMSKDYGYIRHRYFEHPIYQYYVWKIVDTVGKAHSILITREETQFNKKICKIVDYYGDISYFSYITAALDRMIKEKEYEFVDVYSYGVDTAVYEQAGFLRCDENCENIIPNYYHPFEQKNVAIRMIDPMIEGMRLFLGDGDQDRPC